jgi:pimeloyl-ACP methyl ester carboxylesterase
LNRVVLEVDEYGAGPPLVLIHGSPANEKNLEGRG